MVSFAELPTPQGQCHMMKLIIVLLYSILFSVLLIGVIDYYFFEPQHLNFFRDGIRDAHNIFDLQLG